MKQFKTVCLAICIVIILVVSACALDPSLQETSTPGNDANASSVPAESPAATALPDNVFADKYLGHSKTVEVTGGSVYLYEKLGVSKTTVITIANCSVETDSLTEADLCEVKINDNTGRSITINLSQADKERLLALIGYSGK